MSDPLMTPYEVERKLLQLSRELDANTQDLIEANSAHILSKRREVIALARARANLSENPASKKYTVQEKADLALLECESILAQADADEIWVKGTRFQVDNLRAQVDIIRSIGTSVRSSMDMA